MAGQDHGTESGEAEEDKAEDSVDEAEEGRADAVGHESNDYDQRGEPSHQAGGRHQDSPPGGFRAEDGIGKGEPARGADGPVFRDAFVTRKECAEHVSIASPHRQALRLHVEFEVLTLDSRLQKPYST